MREENRPAEMAYRLLVVDDEESIRVSLQEALSDPTHTVMTAPSGTAALALLASEVIDLVLLDQKLKESGEDGIEVLREIRRRHPEVLVIMMTAYGRIESAVEATKLGCFQYITKPLDVHQLRLLIHSALSTSQLQRQVEMLRQQQDRVFRPSEMFGSSPKTRELLEHVRRAAASPTSTVLIRGETGVGKELIARQIHASSPVAQGAFVDFNCSAVPDNLIESELFGYEKGAFTDAKGSKRGLFELADRGSLFLDEIAEMPLTMQAKLLRVLETKSFRRLGSTVDVKVQVRVIAATNKDLFQEVESGRFREDLFYRLDVIPVHVPALRDRPEDIPFLARHFLERFNRELGRSIHGISDKAMEYLCAYSWPGNVRELRNLLERTVLMTTDHEILPDHLPPQILAGGHGPRLSRASAALLFPDDRILTLDEIERAAIQHTLSRVGGNKTKAAEALGISRQTLRTKLKDADADEE
ncbi:MAG: sigma-54-dependent transcriptional regulator [Candidatus Eisenbacteria bacterium]